MTFKAIVRHGSIVPHDPAILQRLPEVVDLQVVKQKRYNSTPQQGYFFAVICKYIADETGEDIETVSEYLKRFRPVREVMGEPVPKRLKDMTTAETEDFHTACRAWAAQFLGLFIPLPNEVESW